MQIQIKCSDRVLDETTSSLANKQMFCLLQRKMQIKPDEMINGDSKNAGSNSM